MPILSLQNVAVAHGREQDAVAGPSSGNYFSSVIAPALVCRQISTSNAFLQCGDWSILAVERLEKFDIFTMRGSRIGYAGVDDTIPDLSR